MRVIFKISLNFLTGSFLLIAFSAVALVFATQSYPGQDIRPGPLHLFIFSSTLATYNLRYFIKNLAGRGNTFSSRNSLFNAVFCFYLLLMGSLLFFLRPVSILLIIPVALLVVMYSIPEPNYFRYLSVRRIPYLKAFIIAFVWSFVTTILPFTEMSVAVSSVNLLLVFSARFLLVLAVAIPFDIRDLTADKASGIKTLPVALGVKNSLRMALACAFVFPFVVLLQETGDGNVHGFLAASVTSALLLVILLSPGIKIRKFYYTVYLDGILLFYGLATMAEAHLFR